MTPIKKYFVKYGPEHSNREKGSIEEIGDHTTFKRWLKDGVFADGDIIISQQEVYQIKAVTRNLLKPVFPARERKHRKSKIEQPNKDLLKRDETGRIPEGLMPESTKLEEKDLKDNSFEPNPSTPIPLSD